MVRSLHFMGIFLLTVCLCTSAFAGADLGIAGNYNAFIFDDFTGLNSDVQGRLAAGGDVSLMSYGVGSGLPTATTTNTLTVGGNLSFVNGQVNGSAIVGGTASGPFNVTGTLAQNAPIPVGFATEKNYLLGLSSSLATNSANGTVQEQWGGMTLTGDNTGSMQVFNVSGTSLSSIHTLNLSNIANDATVLINVSGDTGSMQNFGFHGFDSHVNNVLFNFSEATTLTLTSVGIKGSILAPNASVIANYGNMDGTIIANSWNGTMQLHNVPFESTPSTPPSPVPAPGAIMLLSGGLMSLAGLKRRFLR